MRCLASSKKTVASKIISDSKANAMEYILTAAAYAFLEKLGWGDVKTHFMLQKINYYASILTENKEEVTLQMYKDILKSDYDFELKFKNAYNASDETARGGDIKNVTSDLMKNLALTIIAYVAFDKLALKPKRVDTIIKRIVYYANPIIEKDDKVLLQKYKDTLKEKYNFTLLFYR